MRICYLNSGLFIVISFILPFIPLENIKWQVLSPLFFVCSLAIVCVPTIIANKAIILLSPVQEQRDLAFSKYAKANKINKVLAAGCIALGIVGILCFSNRIHACLLASAILIVGGLLMVSMPGIVAGLLVKATRSKSMNSQETFNNHLE